MWPVMERGAPPAASSMPYLVSSWVISSSVSQMGISMATVLELFASMKFCSVSCRSLLVPTAGMISAAVSVAVFSLRLMTRRLVSANAGLSLRSAGLWIVFSLEELVRAGRRNGFEKGCERFEALMLRIAAQKCELRAMIGEGVDLAVIELDRADGLRGRIDRRRFGA